MVLGCMPHTLPHEMSLWRQQGPCMSQPHAWIHPPSFDSLMHLTDWLSACTVAGMSVNDAVHVCVYINTELEPEATFDAVIEPRAVTVYEFINLFVKDMPPTVKSLVRSGYTV